MYVAEEPVAQHGAHRRFFLRFEKIEERGMALREYKSLMLY